MNTETDFLDLYEGDKAEISYQDEDDIVRSEKTEIISIISIEPRIVDDVPIRGKKVAFLDIEASEENEVYWIEMPREVVGYEQDIKYGKQKAIFNQEEIAVEVQKRETTVLGTVESIEVINDED